jgi:ABC-type molybdate transport system substrate-binding protein
MISGGCAACRELAPSFERASGNRIVAVFGPSMGSTPAGIPVRLARGEPADVLIMADQARSNLIRQGKVLAESRVELARSRIGIVVRATSESVHYPRAGQGSRSSRGRSNTITFETKAFTSRRWTSPQDLAIAPKSSSM